MQLSNSNSLANSYNSIPTTQFSRLKTINTNDLRSNNDLNNNRNQWRSINQFESRRNTPVMNGFSGRLTSPRTALAFSTSSSSSSSSNITTTATTSSSADSDSKRSIIIQKLNSNNNKKQSHLNNNNNNKNRHSLTTELVTRHQPQKLENFVQNNGMFHNSNLMRKSSLPPDKSFKQLQIYEADNNNKNTELIASQKPYSNLYPDEKNSNNNESPKFQNKLLAGQEAWALVKRINERPPSQMRTTESSSNSSASPENMTFQQADFTPQLHRLSQKQSPPSVPLRRKQVYEVQQSQQNNSIYSKQNLSNSIESTDSAIMEVGLVQLKTVARIKNSNESLNMLRQQQFEPQKETTRPNVSALKKFFKDNNPFENLMGRLNNNSNNNNGSSKFCGSATNQENIISDEKVLISIRNSTSNETISNELKANKICVEAAITPIVVTNISEKVDKKRKYRTLKTDKKKVMINFFL